VKKLTAEERFERLFTLVPEVVKSGGIASLSELSQRFEYPLESLKSDLKDIMRFVAPWPRTFDLLPQIGIEGDTVIIANADFFKQPPQLAWEEALSLYTSAAAVLGARLPSSDDLKSAAEKLRRVLEAKSNLENFERILGVDVAEEIPDEIWSDILVALRERRKLRINYYSFGKGKSSVREVDIHGVFVRRESWHISCWCHRAQDVRIFKCDQIEHSELLDEQFQESANLSFSENKIYQAQASDARVNLKLKPEAFWVTQAYDIEHQKELPDGSLEVRLAIGNKRFLEYLLLLLGNSAELMDSSAPSSPDDSPADDSPSDDIPSDLASQAVGKILARYLNDQY